MSGSNLFLVVAKYFLCVIIHEIAKCDKTREFPPKFRARLKDFVGAPLPRSKGISHPDHGYSLTIQNEKGRLRTDLGKN